MKTDSSFIRRRLIVMALGFVAFSAFAAEDFSQYANKAIITFSGYEGATTLTNFPALVKIADGVGGFSYAACAQPDGGDVRFSLANGEELPSECVSWNTSGTSEFWVCVPELTAETVIGMFWGNSSAAPRRKNVKVWDLDYRAVWNMDDYGYAILDSSLYSNHGAAQTVSARTDGMVGKARDIADRKFAQCGFGSNTDFLTTNYTWECWYKLSSLPGGNNPIVSLGSGNQNMCALCVGSGNGIPTSNSGTFSGSAVSLNEWHHALVSETGGTATFYLDGRSLGTKGVQQPKVENTTYFSRTSRVRIGYTESTYFGSQNCYFTGAIDELRFSGVARSADYAKAVFMNVASNDVFQTISETTEEWPSAVVADKPSTLYLVTITAGEGGSVSNAQNSVWLPAGSSVTVCAKPSDSVHKAFYKWLGDCPEADIFTAEITVPVDRARTLTAQFATAHYVRPERNGNNEIEFSDLNDGLTPETAKCTLEATLAVLPDDEPSCVWLYDGTYKVTNTVGRTTGSIRLSKPVAVRSVNGPGKVAFDGQDVNYREPFNICNSGAVLDGITLKRCRQESNNYSHIWMSSGRLQNCIITNCSEKYYGDTSQAIDISGGMVRNTLFTGLKGATGSSIRTSGQGAVVDSCMFMCNEGGHIRHRGGIIRNCLFYANTNSISGGGVELVCDGCGYNALVEGCTFIDNKTAKNGGGVCRTVVGSSAACGKLVINCAFLGNSSSSGATGPDCWDVAVVNSCGTTMDPVMGNICSAPTFASDDDGLSFRPRGTSVLRNGAAYSRWMWEQGARDITGAPRIEGESADIGAFEYVSTGDEKLEVNVVASVISGVDSVSTSFTPTLAGLKGAASYLWEFGDGETSTDERPSHTYAAAGYYTVRLTVSDSAGGGSCVFTGADMIKVMPSTVYVHKQDADHVPREPYATPATAAGDVYTAYAMNPSRIIVLAGPTVPCGNGVDISTVCEITGEGTDVSTVSVAQGCQGLNFTKSGASLHNMRLVGSGGSIGNYNVRLLTVGGGVTVTNVVLDNYIANNFSSVYVSGTLSHAIIRNCKKGCSNVNGQALEVGAGGLIDCCVVTNNTLYYSSSGGDGVAITASGSAGKPAVVRNTLVAYNWVQTTKEQAAVAAYGNTVMENCTIVSNRSMVVGGSGGLYIKGSGVSITNTIVHSNTSGDAAGNILLKAGETAIFSHCCAPELGGIVTCTADDPLFNLDWKPELPYWSIRSKSPCKGTGAKADWMEGATDLDGNPRIFGRRPDIGCYENMTASGLSFIVR